MQYGILTVQIIMQTIARCLEWSDVIILHVNALYVGSLCTSVSNSQQPVY